MLEAERLETKLLLDLGIVEPSKSPWSTNVVLVKKKNLTHSMVQQATIPLEKTAHKVVSELNYKPEQAQPTLEGKATVTTREGGKVLALPYSRLRVELLPPSGRRSFDIQLECAPPAADPGELRATRPPQP